ncbi:MAG TPA: alkaline phosphatase family protein [Anaerolineae bacterium]|nr:alkaline phosphatase family protein [Anaerolineae bacterium]
MARRRPDAQQQPMAQAVREAYARGEEDEALEPLVLVDRDGERVGRIRDGDYVIFYNIRGEREVELTSSFVDPHFGEFPTEKGIKAHFATMIQYDESLDVQVAFPPLQQIDHTLSQVISDHGLEQVKITESEKAIHLQYFLNGKRDEAFPGEERIIVPSPRVVDYTQVPQMNVAGVTKAALEKIAAPTYDVIVANFVNVDVVGHIENQQAIIRAVETVDSHLGQVVDAAQEAGITTLITADHGTVEKWLYSDGTIDTGHTDSPVPFIIISPDPLSLRDGGALADVAPTVLELLGLPKPHVMTGRSLVQNASTSTSGSRRVLLLIVDGWGFREELHGNLIAQARTPAMDRLRKEYPFTVLAAAGKAVGMPEGTVGNSEAGHLHLGAGRMVYSDRLRIEHALQDGSFFENPAFLWAMRGAKRDGRRLHLLGIVSFYSSHGSVDHLLALLRMAKREELHEVYVHSMLGRRGEHPESGAKYIEQVEEATARLGVGKLVSVIGRFWSLDREENWDRIEKSYRWLIHGEARPVREVS